MNDVFEENACLDFALFNQMVSGYRLGATSAWIIRKPLQPIIITTGRNARAKPLFVIATRKYLNYSSFAKKGFLSKIEEVSFGALSIE